MPEIVFVGPPQKREPFRYVLFTIDERDANGIPRKLTMHQDKDVIDVTEQSDFMTGYVPEHMAEPREKAC